MDLINITLWTISLSLALIGILFGIIASINSGKANKKVQDLIETTFITEESQKFLYDNLKTLITYNRKALKVLGKGMTYSDYSFAAAHTRMHMLSKSAVSVLIRTEFRDIVMTYIDTKKLLDKKFLSIIDLKLLSTKKTVPVKIQEELESYHKEVINSASNLIKLYTSTISYTSEIDFKK